MKCTCETCLGTGHVVCQECNGDGSCEDSIEHITLSTRMDNYDELAELQRDAWRVIEQAEKLKAMRPERAAVYEAQLSATLETINKQADAAAK